MLSLVVTLIVAADPPMPTPAWTPRDKEMVVLLGSAFIEQEARDGYLETELIRLFPNKDIRVRNLGWSGDTVHCQARSYFGPPEEGFERLRGHLQMIKPTTVICCYGANESWKGEPGIPDFRKGYERLIDMIRLTTGATVVLMTPPSFDWIQVMHRPALKTLQDANERLARYWQEARYVADSKATAFWQSETTLFTVPDFPSTSDGVTWTSEGYERFSKRMRRQFDSPNRIIVYDFDAARVSSKGADVQEVQRIGNRLTWSMRWKALPQAGHLRGLKGPYEPPTAMFWDSPVRAVVSLKTDGKSVITDRPVNYVLFIPNTIPDFEQVELLRQAIIKKNALFFHRWRPANETYLYGFRKHEQGNNAVEPPSSTSSSNRPRPRSRG